MKNPIRNRDEAAVRIIMQSNNRRLYRIARGPAVPLAGSYKVMGELREIISEIAPDSSNPLLLEEYGAQLLDQIEHMARASQDAAAPARPSTS